MPSTIDEIKERLPQEALDVLEQKAADAEPEEPQDEETKNEDLPPEPADQDEPSGEEEKPDKTKGLSEYRELQKRAKELGIDPKGKAEELREAIERHEAEYEELKNQARFHGFRDEDFERYQNPEDLRRVVAELDRRLAQQGWQQPQQQYEQQAYQQEPNQPPPEEPDFEKLIEAYGEDDPAVGIIRRQHAELQEVRGYVSEIAGYIAQMEQQRQAEQVASEEQRFLSELDQLGYDDLLGKGPMMERAPDQRIRLNDIYQTAAGIVHASQGQVSPQEAIRRAANAVLHDDLQKRNGRSRADALKQHAKTRLGSSSGRQAPAKQDKPKPPQSIYDNELLRQEYEKMAEDPTYRPAGIR